MIEILTALGLALSAGLNAYIPLLAVGLLARFTEVINLPNGWRWMENEWVLVLFGALVLVEFFADKIAAIDSLNDVIQTAIRPTSGGLLFTASTEENPVPITQVTDFMNSPGFTAFIIGLVVALIPHLLKMFIRPMINATTGGMVAPLVSFGEDLVSVGLIALSVFIPVLVPVAAILLAFIAYKWIKRLVVSKQAKTA
jgi:hypothetical protein